MPVSPFLLAMLLGAMLPTTDFDVKEYHLQGPKEWWQAGRIAFLPHNVYTSFPFLTEMLSLWGMVLRGDWYRGALIGQVVLMAFAPLTAIAIFAICRPANTTAGWIGAGVFLTTPWVYRISTIAYAEGGWTFFLAATFLAYLNLSQSALDGAWHRRLLLCGVLAGSDMGCKYPGLVTVTVPIGLAVVWTVLGKTWRGHSDVGTADPHAGSISARGGAGANVRPMLSAAAVFSLGVAITFGPWALKNVIETGNPVYPLAYTIFGGRDWTPELNDKWRNGHKGDLDWHNPGGIPADLRKHAEDVAVNSVWQSPFVFALAPLVLVTVWSRRRSLEDDDAMRGAVRQEPHPAVAPRFLVLCLTAYAAWLFLTWWGLTHRIDRFWLPMLPIVCALAGLGGATLVDAIARLLEAGRRPIALGSALVFACLAILATAYNLTMATSGQSGFNAYLLDETAARLTAMRQTPSIALLDARLPQGAKVLMVGEAAVFDAKFPLRYNTVFDFELLQAWATDDPLSLHKADIPLKSRDEIVAKLRSEGITHVFVNWLEILRYREPGSYTYTDFISPRTLQKLVEIGVLNPVHLPPQEASADSSALSPGKQQEIERWAPELRSLAIIDGERVSLVRAFELYTVADK
ncbi:MAG: phospholipid carrier-dependent glycosyltransferase [Planctomycetaceae bacterium]